MKTIIRYRPQLATLYYLLPLPRSRYINNLRIKPLIISVRHRKARPVLNLPLITILRLRNAHQRAVRHLLDHIYHFRAGSTWLPTNQHARTHVQRCRVTHEQYVPTLVYRQRPLRYKMAAQVELLAALWCVKEFIGGDKRFVVQIDVVTGRGVFLRSHEVREVVRVPDHPLEQAGFDLDLDGVAT